MSPLAVRVRPLEPADLPAIMAIEEAVFPLPWPASAYRKELSPEGLGVFRGLAVDGRLVAYGGFWLLADEAHLMTIAVAVDWQRQGLGEWLLLHLLDAMEEAGAWIATLEVRAGNAAAQALYRRLGFEVVGRRRRYYSDNQEDALIMSTPPLRAAEMVALRERRRRLLQQTLPGQG